MKISIIIPCYNEVNYVEEIVDRIHKKSPYENEIIVIDDDSKDGTREILNKMEGNKISKLIKNDKNYGKGYCIRQGIKFASGEIIIIQDADLEYDPSDYVKLIDPIKDNIADVVFGSRFIGMELVRVHLFWHRIGNLILTTVSNIMTNLNLTDMEICYKAFKADILKNINLYENRFGFEPEVTAKISKIKKIRIYEVPVKYFGRSYSEGKKIGWKDGLSALRCVFYYNLFSK